MAVYLGVLGAALGSFVDAVVWRLHTGRSLVSGRSECESCHRRLGVLDLVPVVSWLLLRGRCRYCGARIAASGPVVEASLAALFVISYLRWTDGVASLVLWLVFLVALAALALYDVRWGRLPDVLVLPLIPVALVDAALRVRPFTLGGYATHVLLGVAVLGGLYAVLHAVSRGRWVGLGDVKLGVFAGIVLGWPAALLALAVANALGAAVAVAGLATGRLGRKSRIPFGPFLAAGFAIAGLWVSA